MKLRGSSGTVCRSRVCRVAVRLHAASLLCTILSLGAATAILSGCVTPKAPAARFTVDEPIDETGGLIPDLEHRTFEFFWATANPKNGLVPDRYPAPSFASIAAVGFALTAYPIGVERGYVTRAAARARVPTHPSRA